MRVVDRCHISGWWIACCMLDLNGLRLTICAMAHDVDPHVEFGWEQMHVIRHVTKHTRTPLFDHMTAHHMTEFTPDHFAGSRHGSPLCLLSNPAPANPKNLKIQKKFQNYYPSNFSNFYQTQIFFLFPSLCWSLLSQSTAFYPVFPAGHRSTCFFVPVALFFYFTLSSV